MGDARLSISSSVSSQKGPSSVSATSLPNSVLYQRACAPVPDLPTGDHLLPAPVTTPAALSVPLKKENGPVFLEQPPPPRPLARSSTEVGRVDEARKEELGLGSRNLHTLEGELLELSPAEMPPKYHLNDLFPFSLFVGWRAACGENMKGKKAAKLKARSGPGTSGNLPLEISLYLVGLTDFAFVRRW